MIGVAPGPFSLRELVWMAEGRQREAWNHTAAILAWLENTSMGKKGAPTKPLDRHPFKKSQPKRKLSREESIRRLNSFVGIQTNG